MLRNRLRSAIIKQALCKSKAQRHILGPYKTGNHPASSPGPSQCSYNTQSPKTDLAIGVELWICRGQVDPSTVFFQWADPRRLLAHLRLLGRPLSVMVGHALPSDSGGDDIRQRWADAAAHLRANAKEGAPWILLFDANARIEGGALEVVQEPGMSSFNILALWPQPPQSLSTQVSCSSG